MKKTVLIIGMGGTIAGIAPNPNQDPLMYHAGKVPITDILSSNMTQDLLDKVQVRSLQLSNIKSGDLTESLLSQLADCVIKALNDDQCDGIVITHGTDTIEETGIFLHLTCSSLAHESGKVVVLTGAMLPSNAPNADGPDNLNLAIKLAAFREDFTKKMTVSGGIYGSFAQKVVLAKDYVKRSAIAINAPVMDSADFHSAMSINPDGFKLDYPRENSIWPWVEIITNHVGAKKNVLEYLIDNHVEGIVFAGSGQGNIHENLVPTILKAKSKHLPMIRASRTLLGKIRPEVSVSDALLGTVAARNLSPAKARIALQLFIFNAKSNQGLDLNHLFDII